MLVNTPRKMRSEMRGLVVNARRSGITRSGVTTGIVELTG